MGIFDIFKPKQEPDEKNDSERLRNLVLLSKLEINPYDFHHDDMETCEISFEEELEGDIKTSDLAFSEGENEFDYISLTDKKDNRKSLFKSIINPEERKVQKFINDYFRVLGKDFVDEKEFTSEDLKNFKKLESGHLRTWYPFNFEVVIGFNSNEIGKTLYIIINER